jgi:hypothetical protein
MNANALRLGSNALENVARFRDSGKSDERTPLHQQEPCASSFANRPKMTIAICHILSVVAEIPEKGEGPKLLARNAVQHRL